MLRTVYLFLFLSNVLAAQVADIPAWEKSETTGTAATLRAGGKSFLQSTIYLRPRPALTAAELTRINPALPRVLQDFPKLLEGAQLSSRYQQLYDTKLKSLRRGSWLTPHNYFDCETALLLTHPESGRKVFFLQADMDVVTDGSDPIRQAELARYNLARSSDWFLPETAYSWTKKGGQKNPFLDYYPETLKKLEKLRAQLVTESKKDQGVVWREMIRACDAQIYRVKERGLHSSTKTNLTKRSFLLADRDPFVVLPVPWVRSKATFAPRMGDYAAVIYGAKIYPAILGDAGPSAKVGEASLCLARALNPKANGRNRAVSDLTVSYLFFPGSRDPAAQPDLKKWHRKVSALLTEIGGLG